MEWFSSLLMPLALRKKKKKKERGGKKKKRTMLWLHQSILLLLQQCLYWDYFVLCWALSHFQWEGRSGRNVYCIFMLLSSLSGHIFFFLKGFGSLSLKGSLVLPGQAQQPWLLSDKLQYGWSCDIDMCDLIFFNGGTTGVSACPTEPNVL